MSKRRTTSVQQPPVSQPRPQAAERTPRRSTFSLEDLTGPDDPTPDAPAAPEPAQAAKARKPLPKAINMYVTPEDHKRMLMLSVSLGTKLQRLGHEAWNLLLTKHGLPELEPENAPSNRARQKD